MLGSGAGGKKPIKEAEKLRARKAKLERVSSKLTKHKNADEKLYKAQADWERTFDAISDWIALIDLKGRILRTNRSGEDFTGISSAQIVGQFCCKLVHGSEEHTPGCPLQKMLHTRQRESTELKVPDTNRWLIVTVDPIVDKEGNLIGAVHITRDITERKQAEKLLKDSEERLKKYVDNIAMGISIISPKMEILDMNEIFKRWFPKIDLSMKPICFKSFYDPPKEEICTYCPTVKAFKDGKSHCSETDLCVDGNYYMVAAAPLKDDSGKVTAVIQTVQNITERKKAEEQIAKLAKFPAENPNPVLRISGRGTVIFANKAGANLLKTWDCRVGKSVTDRWHELVMDSLSSGQSQQTEVQFDGRIFSLTFAPVVNANYVNVYGLDITERKQAEERLLEHQAKLKAMASEMLRTEEHERQRLAVGLHDEVCQKLVLTKLALESSLNLVSDSKVLASLRIACGAIGETIEQADSLTFELSNPVLRQLGFVIALEKYLTEEIRQRHGIEYELESDEQLGTLQDEIKNCLFRVTRELLTNVVKHAHARKVKVSARESQSQIYVRVQDDGVGFKESQASAEVSQTARFGLFSIREQLEYLGGHLEIESEPGQGTKATVVVPLRGKATV